MPANLLTVAARDCILSRGWRESVNDRGWYIDPLRGWYIDPLGVSLVLYTLVDAVEIQKRRDAARKAK